MKFSDIVISIVVLAVILLIIVPLPPFLLDILLVISITVALMVLLITLYTTEPLQFSTFPPLLLILTLFRLGLNIASTRLILGNNGDAGNVIETFGSFVVQGNLVVGLIIFLIIIMIQFIVITKGAERVAEVAARFTLDAMPGKQMAIDADLNTGVIDEVQARERRLAIQREADFYGSMDGASKFVKGDAILGIIITIINVVGGMIIGLVAGQPIEQVVSVYTLATVGDGLSSQLPALMISTATGIIVTRAASANNMGTDLMNQIKAQPLVMILAGVMLLVITLIPGLPKIPLLVLAITLITLGVVGRRRVLADVEEEESVDQIEEMAAETRRPESVISLLQVDPIELEFGYSIIPLADASQGGDLLDRVVMIRRQCALEMGMIVPTIRLRDNIQLGSNEYVIKIKGNEVARGEVVVDHYLAMNTSNTSEAPDGIETIEPVFNLPAIWVNSRGREEAEVLGYTIVDPPSVIATHLTEILKRHGYELMGRQQVQLLLDNLKQTQPMLVDDVVPRLVPLGQVQKVISNLLREGVSVRDLTTILETIGDYASVTHDSDMLTEYVRQNLKRAITKKFVPDNIARVIGLDPQVEQLILQGVRQTEHGSYCVLEPDTLQAILTSLKRAIEDMSEMGIQPILLSSPVVRYHFKRITESMAPDLVVLSYNELEQDVEIHTDGMVTA